MRVHVYYRGLPAAVLGTGGRGLGQLPAELQVAAICQQLLSTTVSTLLLCCLMLYCKYGCREWPCTERAPR